MNDDDKRIAAWIAFCCLVGAAAILLVVTSLPARAAALLDMGGQKIVVLTAEEFIKVLEAKDAEIAMLQSKLDTRKRVECPVI